MKKKAVIYTRVSTSEQTKGYSLQSQVKGCQRYAKLNGLEITAVFQEDISGATHLAERPKGSKLLEMSEQGQVQAVIVWRLDRLSRPPEGEYSRLLTTIEYLARHEVSVHDCETGEVKNDMTSIMIAFFKGLAASQERSAIRERTMRGIQEKAEACKWIGQGDPPFGYRKKGKGRNTSLEIHEERASIVRRIFALYTGKEGRPLSLKQIAVLFTHEGVPTPGQAKKGGRIGKGGWYPSTISKRILANRNYLGYFKAQGYSWHQPELIIIDQETWDKAQARKEANKKTARRNRKRKYLLASRIKCICGGAMVGLSKKRRKEGYNVYYHCLKRRYDHIEKCPVKYLRADAIESNVWNWLCDLLSNPQLLHEGLQHMTEKAQVEMEPIQTRLAIINELLDKANYDISRLVSAFGDEDDETVSRALQSKVKEKIQLKDSIEQERAGLKMKLGQAEFTPELRDQIIEMATKIATTLPNGSFEKKRLLLDMVDLRVQLLPGSDGNYCMRVSCRLAPDPGLIELSDYGFESRCPDRFKEDGRF